MERIPASKTAVSGADPREVNIEVNPENIIVRAEVHHEHREKKGTIHVCEFESGSLFRTIHLPRKINPDKVKAELKNGMLRVSAEIAEESRARVIKPAAA